MTNGCVCWTAAVAAFLVAAPAPAAERTVLAIGAHAGDMEITAAAVLARHKRLGDRVVLLHLTLGEGGNPKLTPSAYGNQKRREAMEAARALGAEVIFGPYRDGELENDEAARRYVAGVIRQVRPTHVLTHWKNSIHRDHAAAHSIVSDALLLAELESIDTGLPPWRGVRAVYYTENWEDPEAFKPYVYVDVSEDLEAWRQCVTRYQFIRGGISPFAYLDYYEALSRVRGAEAGKRHAVAFDVDDLSKKRVLDSLP
ncbi:MAG TPA: PIG-L family deacetylase [Bryobacteraceae bacterium]|nr:PIG-L family deacetylase [Bryobacteraceae bacterium]